MPSDPQIDDINRTGDDLVNRILELTGRENLNAEPNGWRPLLYAAGVEIESLRRRLLRIQLLAKDFKNDK